MLHVTAITCNWVPIGQGRAGGHFWIPAGYCPVLEQRKIAEPSTAPRRTSAPASGLEILYVNDLHGDPLPLAGLIRDRQAAWADEARRGIAISGGDEHGGGSAWDICLGRGPRRSLVWDMLERLGFELIVPGNHDLDMGVEAYLDWVAKSPGLIRILSHSQPNSPLAATHAPALLCAWNDHIVGFLGALNLEQTLDAATHLLPPEPALSQWLQTLLPIVDQLVIISHLGLQTTAAATNDAHLLQHLPPGALLLGAHTHQVIPPPAAPQPGNYLQTGQKAQHLGIARLEADGWQVHNIPAPSDPIPTADPDLLAACATVNLAAGVKSFDPDIFAAEQPNRDGYLYETSHYNWVTDQLWQSYGSDPATMAAVCVRLLGSEPLTAKMQLTDWYQRFGYADQIFALSLPKNCLWHLLNANLQRLLLPPSYIESRGMLHFSGNLRIEFAFGSNGCPQVEHIQLNGCALEPNQSPPLRLLTHAYVAMGMGGYSRVFAEAGIDLHGLQRQQTGPSLRDWLWQVTPA